MQVEKTAIQTVDEGKTSIRGRPLRQANVTATRERLKMTGRDTSLLDSYEHIERVRLPTANNHFGFHAVIKLLQDCKKNWWTAEFIKNLP